VIRGPWLHTILFEIPVLAIINESTRRTVPPPTSPRVVGRLRQDALSGMMHAVGGADRDYGTRRRFSRSWHDEVLRTLKSDLLEKPGGTSK